VGFRLKVMMVCDDADEGGGYDIVRGKGVIESDEEKEIGLS